MAKVAFDLLKQAGKTIKKPQSLTAGFQATLSVIFRRISQGGFVTIVWKKSKMLSTQLKRADKHEWCLIYSSSHGSHRPVS